MKDNKEAHLELASLVQTLTTDVNTILDIFSASGVKQAKQFWQKMPDMDGCSSSTRRDSNPSPLSPPGNESTLPAIRARTHSLYANMYP